MICVNLRDVERRAFDIIASSILRYINIDKWIYGNIDIQLPFITESNPDDIHVFEREIEIPETRYEWFLKISISGNALLLIDDKPYAGIDEAHTYVDVKPGLHRFKLMISPRSLFGRHQWRLFFDKAYLVEVDWNILKTGLWVLNIVRFAKTLPRDMKLRSDIEKLLYDTMTSSRLNPSLRQIVLAISLIYETVKPSIRRIDLPEAHGDYVWLADVYSNILKGHLEDIPTTRIEDISLEVERITRELSKGLGELRVEYPKIGVLYITGHSHIDAAWLWPRNETREKILRTFSTILKYMEHYDFTYVQSSAKYYEWIEETNPLIFGEIRRLINLGKWIIVGGMWVESDTNIVDSEALARQFLYGQRYFLDKFGRIARIGWLPDSFGYTGNLPQIMRKSGLEVFIAHKVMWNDTNEFPLHIFRWRGIDGTEIPVQIMTSSYNEPLTPDSIYRYWNSYKQREQISFTIYPYGYGNGGGGPTREMLEYIDLNNSLPSLPVLKHLDEKEYIDLIKKHEPHMSTWSSDLYLEFHRGTYTTDIETKNNIAEAERILVEAETISTLVHATRGVDVGREHLIKLWKLILFNEFHDIISGTSIMEEYRRVKQDLELVVRESTEIIHKALKALSTTKTNSHKLVVFNFSPWSRVVVSKINGSKIPRGVECQETPDGHYVLLYINPLGVTTYDLVEEACTGGIGVNVSESSDGIFVENNYVRLEISEQGDIKSILLRKPDIEILREPATLISHIDKPGVFDAWELTRDFLQQGIPLKVTKRPRVVVKGPLVSCIEVVKGFEKSEITQYICLYKDIPYIEIQNKISWWSKGILVKHWFKTRVENGKATYDIPFGVIERPAIPLSKWDEARFESPAVRWADLSDNEKGLAIIAPSRHGYSILHNNIALSIIKSPIYPNPWSDVGKYDLTYYIYPHRGSYEEAEVPRISQEVFHKPFIDIIEGDISDTSLIRVNPSKVILTTFKQSHDGNGYILRLYNPYREEVSVNLDIGFKYEKIIETDVIELGEYRDLSGDINKLVVKPFEIKTLKILIK